MKLIALVFSVFVVAASAAAADLSATVAAASKYESGLNAEPLRQLEQAIRESAGNPDQRKEVEAALIQMLAPTSTFEARRFACKYLAVIGTDAALPALAGMLKDPETTGIACLALGSYTSPKANEVLREALPNVNGMSRVQIIQTLGDRRDPEAVSALIEQVRRVDDAAVRAAISALGKIGTPAALKELANLRAKGDPLQMRAAVQASLTAADQLLQGGQAKAAQDIYNELLRPAQPDYVRRAALSGLLRSEKDSTARILEAMRGQDAALKPVAIAAIRTLEAKDASGKFAQEMPKLKPAEQVLLIEALASRGDTAARSAISERLSAEDASVRRAAMSALGRIGDAAVVPVLAKALAKATETEDLQALQAALITLEGGDRVDQAIATVLKDGKDMPKPLLISVLGKRGSKTAVSALLREAGSSDADTAKAAFQALGRIAEADDLSPLLDKLVNLQASDARGAAEGAVARVLSKTPDAARRTAAVTAALAEAKDAEDRCSLLGLLPACGSEKALEALKAARTDKEARIRECALRALADWPDASALGLLLETAQSASDDTERVLALRGAVRALRSTTQLSAGEVAAGFEKAMKAAKTAEERKLVLSGLGNVHHPVALQLVEPYLSDSEVQAEAVLAAVTIVPYVCGADRETARSVLQKITSLPVENDVKQSAKDTLETINQFADFVLAWQVAGPYSETGKSGEQLFDVVFPPEKSGAKDVQWQIMPAGTMKERPWQLDLAKLYGGNNRAAYVRTWIHSDAQQPARLELGSDDGVKAWFNGQVVISANRGGDVAPATHKADVTLKQGWNELLLKVTQWTSGWGYCARLAKPDGSKLEGIRIQPTPPK